MKTKIALLALLLQGLLTETSHAGNLNISIDPSSPINTIAVERALVPILSFRVSGSDTTISRISLQCADGLTNHDIGELVLMLNDDQSERGRASISADGHADIDTTFVFTGLESCTFTVWLRTWSDLSRFNGQNFVLKLVGVTSDTVQTGTLPIVGGTTTLSASPAIGNIIIRPAARITSDGVFANADHQELGSFTADVWQNEAIVSHAMSFLIHSASASNLVIMDESNNVVAGPMNSSWYGEDGTTVVVFTNAVTFPCGRSKYSLYGKLASAGLGPNSNIQVTSPVNLSTWNLSGASYGYRIEPWSGDLDCQPVRVKYGKVVVVLSPNGASTTVPQGGVQTLLGTLGLLTSESAEDENCTQVRVCFSGGTLTNMSRLQIYAGTNCLNSLHPGIISTNGSVDLILDQPLLVHQGIELDLVLKADISSNAVVGSSSTLNVCDNSGDGFVFTGTVTGLSPYVQVLIQFGTQIIIGDKVSSLFSFNNNLTIGSSGYDVLILQRMLGVPETAYYDQETANAVNQFQAAHGIPSTGFVGPITRAILQAVDPLPYDQQIKLSLVRPYWWKTTVGFAGHPYTQGLIEESDDCITWKQIRTIMIAANGLTSYDETSTGPQRFYRFVPLP